MTKDEALRLALEALSEAHYVVEHRQDVKKREQAITAIKAALEAKDEPVAIYRAGQTKGEVYHVQFFKEMAADEVLLYDAPVQRKPLSDEEILLISADCAATHQHTDIHFAKAIEAKLKERTHEQIKVE
jgi:hypothetical protein